MQNQQLAETPARNACFLTEGTNGFSVPYSVIMLNEKHTHTHIHNAQIREQALVKRCAMQTDCQR